MAFCPTSATRHFWIICAGPAWRRLYKFSLSLSALSKLAIDLRVPSAFLFRGYAGANTDSWIDPRKPNEQTIVKLDLCCFGSRTSLPVLWCSKGVQENGLGISPLNMTSVVTGDTGPAVFVLDTNIWKVGLFRGSKNKIFRCDSSVLSFLSS